MGPTTAEIPLKIAVLAIAMPVYSGLPPAQSNAAFGQVDEKPPLYINQCRWSMVCRPKIEDGRPTSAPKMIAKKYSCVTAPVRPQRRNAAAADPTALQNITHGYGKRSLR